MTFEELIRETAARIGLEDFAPDADGVCTLVSDIGEIGIMDCKGAKEMVLLNAAITYVPPDAGAALTEALKANRYFEGTRGATLSIDSETNRFELTQYAELGALNAELMVMIIEEFATTLVKLREKLESAVASGNFTDVVCEFALAGYLRV